jgi:pimeloyl-ACP methyl ester carboxylesterase
VPTARTADGIELHWEQRGEGPAVVLVPYWSFHPSVYEGVTAELERDHRVIQYDQRGCGRSTREGPYDMETSAADLEAVCEAAEIERGLALSLVDGANRAVRVASRRPELIERVVAVGTAPVNRGMFERSDALISSSPVVDAFMQMIETDYRGALRAVMDGGNEQMTEDEVRERVRTQIEYTPQEAAIGRIGEWANDEAGPGIGREIGERMTILIGGVASVGGGWFPGPDEMERVFSVSFPDADIRRIADGIMSAPELTAAEARRLTRQAALDSAS